MDQRPRAARDHHRVEEPRGLLPRAATVASPTTSRTVLRRPFSASPTSSASASVCAGGDYALFLGRLVPEKAPDLLLRAFRSRRHDVAPGDRGRVELHRPVRRGARNRSRRAIRGCSWSDRCTASCSTSCTATPPLFVLPSSLEGLPLTLLEAASYRLPLVASDIPPNREVIGEDGPGGRLFPSGDVSGARRGADGDARAICAQARAARDCSAIASSASTTGTRRPTPPRRCTSRCSSRSRAARRRAPPDYRAIGGTEYRTHRRALAACSGDPSDAFAANAWEWYDAFPGRLDQRGYEPREGSRGHMYQGRKLARRLSFGSLTGVAMSGAILAAVIGLSAPGERIIGQPIPRSRLLTRQRSAGPDTRRCIPPAWRSCRRMPQRSPPASPATS